MDFLKDFSVPVIVGICLCVGYIIKHLIPTDKINRYIPLIMGALGLGLNVWISFGISPEIILGGLASGLASTGAYEAFRQVVGK
ncbi:MAG: phage holin family protein [Acutalibacteraceae bacterium]|nr:phage holin family protein [Acutalibacteraceae bacterium]